MSRVLETTGLESTKSEVDFQPVRGQGCCERVFILFYTAFPRSEENTKPGEPAAAIATELSVPFKPVCPRTSAERGGAVSAPCVPSSPLGDCATSPSWAQALVWLKASPAEKRRKYLGLHLGPRER